MKAFACHIGTGLKLQNGNLFQITHFPDHYLQKRNSRWLLSLVTVTKHLFQELLGCRFGKRLGSSAMVAATGAWSISLSKNPVLHSR